MDIDSPASNELRTKQQNIVKPRGELCENLRLVYSACMLTLLALGLRTVLAKWGWDKGTRKFRKADIIRRALYDAIRPIKAPLILYADPEQSDLGNAIYSRVNRYMLFSQGNHLISKGVFGWVEGFLQEDINDTRVE